MSAGLVLCSLMACGAPTQQPETVDINTLSDEQLMALLKWYPRPKPGQPPRRAFLLAAAHNSFRNGVPVDQLPEVS